MKLYSDKKNKDQDRLGLQKARGGECGDDDGGGCGDGCGCTGGGGWDTGGGAKMN